MLVIPIAPSSVPLCEAIGSIEKCFAVIVKDCLENRMFVISCYVEILLAPNAMKDSCVSVADSKSREKVLRSQIEKKSPM